MPPIAALLERRGVPFHLHRNCFAPDAPDEDWLPIVGERGWVILTRDAAMKRVEVEREALRIVGARQFVVRAASLPAAEVVRMLDDNWNRIAQLAGRGGGGFIAHVTRSGVVMKIEFDRPRKAASGAS